jgi:hypothetical protein
MERMVLGMLLSTAERMILGAPEIDGARTALGVADVHDELGTSDKVAEGTLPGLDGEGLELGMSPGTVTGKLFG